MQINSVYRKGYDFKGRYLVLYGGAGSGKSVFAAQKIVLRCLQEPGHRFLILRKVARTIKGSVFELIKDILSSEGVIDKVYINRSEKYFRFQNGSEIVTSGLDDSEKLKSIHGITGIWIEEATELQEEDFIQADLRLRGETDHYKQVILTFNPISRLHWLYKFVNETNEDKMAIHTTFRDNRFAGDEYEDVLSNIDDENLHLIYAKGEWGGGDEPDQLIKYNYVFNAKEHIKREEGKQRLGVDVARFGDDDTVFAREEGNDLVELEPYSKLDTNETSQKVKQWILEYNIDADMVGVDGVGLGAGVVDNLHTWGYNVKEIISGASPVEGVFGKDTVYQFYDLRSQMWWFMREKLKNGELKISVDSKRLMEDLTAPKYKIQGDKTIRVESKQDIKKRLGRSTDYGDAYVYSRFVKHIRKQTTTIGGAQVTL